MKILFTKLSSLVPNEVQKEGVSVPDQLDGATNYIKKLQMKLEKMKEKKSWLQEGSSGGSNVVGEGKLPSIDIHVMGMALEVVLITGLNCKFMFGETIRIVHEEGAEVVNASFSVTDDTIFHTIHLKINGESEPEYEAARISERLRKFVNDVN
ncbi:hypothetical protein ACJIZ3_006372 [Penstemon smallii]|uniref:BHLH domain-containing protein n=1 Tax=Penstemon smallii TaxID=265156 RepID=A0ABD3S7M1_9LAMI